jgi:hypothetical protein
MNDRLILISETGTLSAPNPYRGEDVTMLVNPMTSEIAVVLNARMSVQGVSEVERLRQLVRSSNEELTRIQQSRSWTITAPIRDLSLLLGRLRRALARRLRSAGPDRA